MDTQNVNALLQRTAELERELAAKNRELEIEAALDRVRTRAMAMESSNELKDLISMVSTELGQLDFVLDRCFIYIFDPRTRGMTWWMAHPETPTDPIGLFVKYHEQPPFLAHVNAWEERQLQWQYILEGAVKKTWDAFLFTETELSQLPEAVIANMRSLSKVYLSASFNNFGGLSIATLEPLSHEQFDVLLRFAKVFDLTYTRFLDLQRAEAQAKEAQIQLALERVRAKALAMQTSDDLIDVANVLREQMGTLGQPELESSIVHLYNGDSETFNVWYAYAAPHQSGGTITGFTTVPKNASEWTREVIDKYRSAETEYTIVSNGSKLREWYQTLETFAPNTIEYDDQGQMIIPEILYYHFSKFSGGALLMISNQQPSQESREMQKRSAAVFDLAYTRFLDLQQAEAQAREAQIQLALERVRARAMAMQKSEELADVATLLFKQVGELGIKAWTTGFNVWSDDNSSFTDYITSPQGGFIEPYTVTAPISILIDARKKREEFLVFPLEGESLKETYRELSKFGDKDQYEKMLEGGFKFPERQFNHFVFGSKVSLMFITYEPVPEAHAIFKRFGKVFEQTYTRFLDLQKAEAQAREAKIEAALEKIRSRSLAMHKSDELKDVIAVVFERLKELELVFDASGIFLFKDGTDDSVLWVANPDIMSEPLLINMPYEEALENSELFKNIRTARTTGDDIHNKRYSYDEKNKYFRYVWKYNPQTPSNVKEFQLRAADYTHTVIMGKKSALVADSWRGKTLTVDEINVLKRIEKVFEQTYARFLDLKKAEAQAIRAEQDLIEIKAARKKAEDALVALKATQAQLIQAEKMASLGELTAGIAHEIQNPLNFVNNFSDTNKELLEELKQELKNGHFEEVNTIATDVISNEQKINHHGKRAEAIVKNMLQHSRPSTGEKQAIDLNALVDEYLRLAYHGFRAKDKRFNAVIKTTFDATITNITIVPQELGRVLLNVFNNAFYAVHEHLKKFSGSYEPTVVVSTKKINNEIEIAVKDNGIGMSQSVIDKIFQPFFTTKPTGEGTGLGLSLSYDIIKAHGGELKVESSEGEGASFTIILPVV